jgi:hypothetical protein
VRRCKINDTLKVTDSSSLVSALFRALGATLPFQNMTLSRVSSIEQSCCCRHLDRVVSSLCDRK